MSVSRCCSRIATQEEEELNKRDYDNNNHNLDLCLRCSSSNFWSELPEDVKVEILCRLPEKDLIGSKFVSKDWNFIISNICIRRFSPPFPSVPLYALLVFEEHAPPSAAGADADDDFDAYAGKINLEFIVLNRKYRFGDSQRKYRFDVYDSQRIAGKPTRHHILDALPAPEHDPADIQDCCNGLLLLASDRLRCPTQYYLCNPVTKQRIAVPVNPNHLSHKTHCSLVFDPQCYDFNYKIIRHVKSAGDATVSDPMGLDVFSSETGEWSSHIVPLEPPILYGFEWIRRSVYWDGVLYYVSLARYLVYIHIFRGADLRARAVELPDSGTTDVECGCIGISSGSLYYSNRHSKVSVMLVWKLVENCTKWILMHSISIDDIVASPPFEKLVQNYRHLELFRPRGFHPNSDQIFMAAPRFILSYHLKTKRVIVHHVPWFNKRNTLVLDQNWIFTYSRCLVVMNSS